jgi:hypothetical protein
VLFQLVDLVQLVRLLIQVDVKLESLLLLIKVLRVLTDFGLNDVYLV